MSGTRNAFEEYEEVWEALRVTCECDYGYAWMMKRMRQEPGFEDPTHEEFERMLKERDRE